MDVSEHDATRVTARTVRRLVFQVPPGRGRALRDGHALTRHERAKKRNALVTFRRGRPVGFGLALERVSGGVREPLTHCPRCRQLLVDEGPAYYCRFGCTRTFPKAGVFVSDRYEAVRAAGGLLTREHPLAGTR